VGPGLALQKAMGESGEIVATLICGDNYFAENTPFVSAQIKDLLAGYKADVVVAGPAFNAGRYGLACGTVCQVAYEELRIPALTGMYKENPALEMYRRYAYIFPTASSAAGLKDVVPRITALISKIASGASLGPASEEGYLPRGIRKNKLIGKTGAERGIDMLLSKIEGRAFKTEYPMPTFSRVIPAKPLADPQNATIAVITTGGIVPKGNPDAIEACFATKLGRYSLQEMGTLTAEKCETAHGGYDPTFANQDPNRILPVDVLQDMESQRMIGKLYDYLYVTVGNGMPVDRASSFGKIIADQLKNDGVSGVILTST